jgi:4-diphosphocytidyl-2-C-methyl-D-erythritol kinase
VGRGEQVYPLEDLPTMGCVVVTPEVGVSTPKAFAAWDRRMSDERRGLKPSFLTVADAALKRRSSTGSFTGAFAGRDQSGKLTVSSGSDRMNELGRGLSAWLGEMCSSAPSGFGGRGRAENPLLWLVRAGIENDFERVVFPEYPELSGGKSALLRVGAKYASLSGSGSTLYGLFGSRAAAVLAAARLRKQGWAAQATATLTRRAYWKRIVG